MAAKKPAPKVDTSRKLGRDDILTAITARRNEVDAFPVEEWEGTVYIRRLDADDLKATGLLDGGQGDVSGMALQLMVTCVADEGGTPLFTEADLQALAKTEFPVILKIFGAVAKTNGLSDAGLEEAMQAFAGAQLDASSTS